MSRFGSVSALHTLAALDLRASLDPSWTYDTLGWTGNEDMAQVEAKLQAESLAQPSGRPVKIGAQTLGFLLENSVFLILGTGAALVLANANPSAYHAAVHGIFGATNLTLHFLVNDVLMCFFFAMAAKEIWEALLPGGPLSSVRKAITPLFATLGGVLGPALLYIGGTVLFARHDLQKGWAVPTATDIAFSYLVARLVFGARHPAIPFLLLLAIADDAIGLLILAVFYPQGPISVLTLSLCVGAAISFNLVLRKMGVKSFWPYLLLAGPLSWYGFHDGGVHPALALVPIIPTLPHADHDEGLFQEVSGDETQHPTDALNAFERWWKNPVELVLMLFGFCNAGVLLESAGLPTGLVAVALLVGKPIGICLFTLLAVKVLRLQMPSGMDMKDVAVLGTMAGIGFTVALFVSDVAFGGTTGTQSVLDSAKLGALLSFSAVGLSFALARLLGIRKII